MPTTTLLFDADSTPAEIGHEYQLNLSTMQARQSMKEVVAFLRSVTHAEMRTGVSDSW